MKRIRRPTQPSPASARRAISSSAPAVPPPMSSAIVSGSHVVEYTHSESFSPSSMTSIDPEVVVHERGVDAVREAARRVVDRDDVLGHLEADRGDDGASSALDRAAHDAREPLRDRLRAPHDPPDHVGRRRDAPLVANDAMEPPAANLPRPPSLASCPSCTRWTLNSARRSSWRLRDCVERSRAFCVVDRRLSPRRRVEELERLGATDVVDADGTHGPFPGGRDVDADVGAVVLTSGSSGAPKAAELTWDALRASAATTQSALGGAGAGLVPVPARVPRGGLAVLLSAVLADATLVWGPPGRPRGGCAPRRDPRRGRARPAASPRPVGLSTAYFSAAGAPPGDATRQRRDHLGHDRDRFGHRVLGFGAAGRGRGQRRRRAARAFPDALSRISRRGPRPIATGPDGRDDWFPTGDAGDVVDNRVTVFGRIATVITTGGEKVWPEDLEAALAAVPGVRRRGRHWRARRRVGRASRVPRSRRRPTRSTTRCAGRGGTDRPVGQAQGDSLRGRDPAHDERQTRARPSLAHLSS